MSSLIEMATVSSKGQIVIPSPLRKKAGLKAGDRVIFEYDGDADEMRLRKIETIDALAERFTSYLKPGVKPLENAGEYYSSRAPRI
jgi:AbrB family looped-hinge helix DNA binding protein